MSASLKNAPAAVTDDLGPSAKLTYFVLREIEPATQADLREHTRLPTRTLRYSLGKLEENGAITSRPFVQDARQSVYETA
jgi:DNA-binding MarR family transcriptional regulator